MFNAIANLTKAAAAAAFVPIAVVVDTVMLPFDATEGKDVYGRTGTLLKSAGECVVEAVKPQKD